MSIAYDAGVLIAADRHDREAWLDHETRLKRRIPVVTTAPVVAQVSRSGRQAQLRRFLAGCDVRAFEADDAHAVGRLLAATRAADVVDAHLVLTAAKVGALILTPDPDDLRPLATTLPQPVEIRSLA